MGVKRMFNLSVPTPGKDGKSNWLNIGLLMEFDDGRMAVKLDSMPVGAVADRDGNPAVWDGWVKVFPKEDRAQQTGGRSQGSGNTSGRQGGMQSRPDDDEIPF